ncbi:hypothetical protein [Desulfonema ishimotonii]|uniref:hypothetical protein n=1 Tax=Desulfonema ishimotonii TaxID=45657 RepID=UPI000F582397|nr:hypothetical protein [Desulfonema ishimotonii]
MKETAGIDRTGEMVHNGIPIARENGIKDTQNLIIEDAQGGQVPATFEVLSRWAGGKDDATKIIQWLLVSFPASIKANTTASYYLKSGSPAKRTAAVRVTEDANGYTVDTGSATFVVSKKEMTLFNSVALSNGTTVLQNNGGSRSAIEGQGEASANPPTATEIERKDDHYVCIRVEGSYANTPVGDLPQWNGDANHQKPIYYRIRYEFYAGSPTVIVYHKFYWPGQNGYVSGGGKITVDKVRLVLPDMPDYTSTEIYADASTYYGGDLISPQKASVEQKLRTVFTDSHVAKVTHGTKSKETTFATQPMLINHSKNGSVAVSIDHMKYFEPQSIETDHTGKMNVSVMADNQYFSNYQGTWARVGISVLPASASYSDTIKYNFAPLNYRLFAFPTTDYVKKSKVFLELSQSPSASSAPAVKKYYDELKAVTETTKVWLDKEKYRGLMTWGSLARYASLDGYNETGSGTGWDKVYTGANHTDYHNSWNNVVFQFLLEGNPANLYDLSFMGARRMLHTQIVQPDEEHSISQMGWGFCGYGQYRKDANSSHSYFENMYNYYYMTGDKEVIDIIKVGAKEKSSYVRDSSGNLYDKNSGGVSWGKYVGRTSSQFATIFNFIGHSDDSSYLDNYIYMYHHAFNNSVALLSNGDGKEYAFISEEREIPSGFSNAQFWMLSLYFLHNVYVLYNEWGDLPLGSYDLKISRVYTAFGNTLMAYTAKVKGDGTWGGYWINSAQIFYDGSKIGGTLKSLVPSEGGDAYLYVTGKSNVITALLRAGELSGSSAIKAYGKDGLAWLTGAKEFLNSQQKPWGKENGLMFIRLHHGISYLGGDSSFPPPDNAPALSPPKELKIIDQ